MKYEQIKALNELNIQEFKMPSDMKILWFDILNSDNQAKPFFAGIHTHSFWELHFVFSGNVYYECEGENFEISENQVILIPPYAKHKFLNSDEMIKMSIAFDFKDCDFLKENEICIKARIFNFGYDICENIKAILKYYDKDDVFVKDILKGRILEIIYSVFEILEVNLPKESDVKNDSRVLYAKKYIEYNKHRLISTEEVAKKCYISSKQLNRLFKDIEGKTVFKYISDIKIEYAKELLKKSDFNINEIAFMLGFENESGFYVFFKRYCKITPRDYRVKFLKLK